MVVEDKNIVSAVGLNMFECKHELTLPSVWNIYMRSGRTLR